MTPKTNGLQNVKLQTNPTIFKIEIEENLNVMYEFVFFCVPVSSFSAIGSCLTYYGNAVQHF